MLILLFTLFAITASEQSANSSIEIIIKFNNETNIQDYEIKFNTKMRDSEKRIMKINNVNYSIELQNFLSFLQEEESTFSPFFLLVAFTSLYGVQSAIVKLFDSFSDGTKENVKIKSPNKTAQLLVSTKLCPENLFILFLAFALYTVFSLSLFWYLCCWCIKPNKYKKINNMEMERI